MIYMSAENLPQAPIPPLTLGLRMAISMQHAKISREVMAQQLGVDGATISRWTHDQYKRPPARGLLVMFATLCGVDPDWMIDGVGTMPTPPAFPILVTVGDKSPPKPGTRRATRRNKAYCSTSSGKFHLERGRAA